MSAEGGPKWPRKKSTEESLQESPRAARNWRIKEKIRKGIPGPRERERLEREAERRRKLEGKG